MVITQYPPSTSSLPRLLERKVRPATESESQPEGPTGLLAAPLPTAPDAGGGQDSTMHTTEPPADDDTADDRRDAGAVSDGGSAIATEPLEEVPVTAAAPKARARGKSFVKGASPQPSRRSARRGGATSPGPSS